MVCCVCCVWCVPPSTKPRVKGPFLVRRVGGAWTNSSTAGVPCRKEAAVWGGVFGQVGETEQVFIGCPWLRKRLAEGRCGGVGKHGGWPALDLLPRRQWASLRRPQPVSSLDTISLFDFEPMSKTCSIIAGTHVCASHVALQEPPPCLIFQPRAHQGPQSSLHMYNQPRIIGDRPSFLRLRAASRGSWTVITRTTIPCCPAG
jgi:hypothetical protein